MNAGWHLEFPGVEAGRRLQRRQQIAKAAATWSEEHRMRTDQLPNHQALANSRWTEQQNMATRTIKPPEAVQQRLAADKRDHLACHSAWIANHGSSGQVFRQWFLRLSSNYVLRIEVSAQRTLARRWLPPRSAADLLDASRLKFGLRRRLAEGSPDRGVWPLSPLPTVAVRRSAFRQSRPER